MEGKSVKERRKWEERVVQELKDEERREVWGWREVTSMVLDKRRKGERDGQLDNEEEKR